MTLYLIDQPGPVVPECDHKGPWHRDAAFYAVCGKCGERIIQRRSNVS